MEELNALLRSIPLKTPEQQAAVQAVTFVLTTKQQAAKEELKQVKIDDAELSKISDTMYLKAKRMDNEMQTLKVLYENDELEFSKLLQKNESYVNMRKLDISNCILEKNNAIVERQKFSNCKEETISNWQIRQSEFSEQLRSYNIKISGIEDKIFASRCNFEAQMQQVVNEGRLVCRELQLQLNCLQKKVSQARADYNKFVDNTKNTPTILIQEMLQLKQLSDLSKRDVVAYEKQRHAELMNQSDEIRLEMKLSAMHSQELEETLQEIIQFFMRMKVQYFAESIKYQKYQIQKAFYFKLNKIYEHHIIKAKNEIIQNVQRLKQIKDQKLAQQNGAKKQLDAKIGYAGMMKEKLQQQQVQIEDTKVNMQKAQNRPSICQSLPDRQRESVISEFVDNSEKYALLQQVKVMRMKIRQLKFKVKGQ